MKVKIREVLDDCIADGLRSGYHRAHKYYDEPCEEQIIGYMDDHIWLEIDRRFVFDNEPDEEHYPRGVCTEVLEGFYQLEKKRKADHQIGAWLSAALHDPSVCQSMKDDINQWFECTPQEEVDRLRTKKKQIYEDLKSSIDGEWVGLTKEELQDLCVKSYHTDNAGETHFNRGHFADAIEAKLKEKNT